MRGYEIAYIYDVYDFCEIESVHDLFVLTGVLKAPAVLDSATQICMNGNTMETLKGFVCSNRGCLKKWSRANRSALKKYVDSEFVNNIFGISCDIDDGKVIVYM